MVNIKNVSVGLLVATVLAFGWGIGCGTTAGLFNPAFVNTFSGDLFPLTPGPTAAFVLVRCLNETGDVAVFEVTIEREVLEVDDDGNFIFQDDGTPVTRIEVERKRLTTLADEPANQNGVLFDCSESPVKRVGLGENLLPTDAALFVGGDGPAGAPGFGVTAGNLNPLSQDAGNFNCGDTIVFRAFQSVGVAGGVGLQSFVYDGRLSPGDYAGPDTFRNYSALLESVQREDEP